LLALWSFLAFCPSVLLLAITSHVTENIAPIPFLWIVPLSLYLASFIVCFDSSRWYKRAVFLPLFVVALGAMTYALVVRGQPGGLFTLIALFSVCLFVACMACHGELARLKPHARHLTVFYLAVSVGGMLGGMFVGVIAPRVFTAYHELPIGMAVSALAVAATVGRERSGWLRRGRVKLKWALLLGLIVALSGPLVRDAAGMRHQARLMVRNFYGTLRVQDLGSGSGLARTLYHGRIIHGRQLLGKDKRRWPTTYYTQGNGVGMAILGTRGSGAQRVGVIGLGAGTLAAYGRAGDYYRFYEINPLVAQIAHEQFSFLSDSPATIEVALGDARLSLEREHPEGFDVLAVDAFSGDSIPVHLLTKEAFALYFRHVKPEGVVAVHVSNKFLDLAPVVGEAARALGKQARLIDTRDDDAGVSYGATWVLVSTSPGFFSQERLAAAKRIDSAQKVRLWTDDFTNIYPLLR